MMLRLLSLLLFGLAPALVGCGQPSASPPAPSPSAKADTPGFVLTSPAFKNDEAIPMKYTRDREGFNPRLDWKGAPAGTKEFALVMDDPDAPGGVFTHWVIYSISRYHGGLAEDILQIDTVPSVGNASQGRNSANTIGYFPPSPPPGKVHHYVFHFYALDKPLPVSPDMTADDLRKAMSGHVLAVAELTGTYQRTR